MNKTLAEIEALLNEKIPRDVVSKRDGGGGRKLDYLEGWYVIDRLNQIFGPTRWSKEITDVRQVVNTTSRGEFPAYIVRVRLTVETHREGDKYPDTAYKEAYGYGCDKSSQNAHELAIKEAVTDALKVAAKDLGMSMGLALYDKSQENVDDGKEEIKPSNGGRTDGGTQSQPSQSLPTTPKHTSTLTLNTDTVKPTSPKTGSEKKAPNREELNMLISSAAKVTIAKKRESLDSVKAHLSTTYKVDTKEALTDAQATEFLEWLKGRYNG